MNVEIERLPDAPDWSYISLVRGAVADGHYDAAALLETLASSPTPWARLLAPEVLVGAAVKDPSWSTAQARRLLEHETQSSTADEFAKHVLLHRINEWMDEATISRLVVELFQRQEEGTQLRMVLALWSIGEIERRLEELTRGARTERVRRCLFAGIEQAVTDCYTVSRSRIPRSCQTSQSGARRSAVTYHLGGARVHLIGTIPEELACWNLLLPHRQSVPRPLTRRLELEESRTVNLTGSLRSWHWFDATIRRALPLREGSFLQLRSAHIELRINADELNVHASYVAASNAETVVNALPMCSLAEQLHRDPEHCVVHASALATRCGVILIPGRSGAGKTSLALAAAALGVGALLNHDRVLLHASQPELLPARTGPVRVGVGFLRWLGTDLERSPNGCTCSIGLPAPASLLAVPAWWAPFSPDKLAVPPCRLISNQPWWKMPTNLSAVVFPSFVPGAKAEMVRMTEEEAHAELARHVEDPGPMLAPPVVRRPSMPPVSAPAYRLTFGVDVEAAVGLLDAI